MDLVDRAVLRAFEEVIDTMAGRTAFEVTAGESGLLPEEITAIVAQAPGVELAVPVVVANAFLADGSGEMLSVYGVDITSDAAVRTYEAEGAGGVVLDDPLAFLSRPDSLMLTHTFATKHGLAVGDRLALDTPTGRSLFTLRGLLEATGVARVHGGNIAIMDLPAAERAFTRPGYVNRVDVVVARDADLRGVEAAIARALPPGLQLGAPAQRKADLHQVMASLRLMLHGVALVVLVAAFLIAFNRLSTSFETRTWQLGVLRAIGLRNGVVWRSLLGESLLLGIAGVTLGIPMGTAIGRLLLPVIATTTALSFNLVAPVAELTVSPASLALAAALGLVASVCAAGLPAWYATQRAVAHIIRARGRERPHPGPAMWMVRGVVLVALAGLLVLERQTRSAACGLAATALAAAAVALAAGPLARLATAVLSPILRRLSSPNLRVAVEAVARTPRRTALMVGTLGVGLGAVLWLWTIASSFEHSVVDTLAAAFRADLVVSSARLGSGFLEAPVDEALLASLREVSGVAAVAGARLADWHYEGGPIILQAFDPEYLRDPGFGRWPLSGRHAESVWTEVAAGRAVIVSSNLVNNLGVQVGDTLHLDTPSGPLALEVAAVAMDFASPRGTIDISRDTYTRYWHDPQITRAYVRIVSGVPAPEVRAAIAAQAGRSYGIRILSSGELVEHFASQVRRAFGVLDIVAGLILLVVLLGMADTLAAGVTERTREIGMLRAIGVPRACVRRAVVFEALLLGMLGLTLGAGAGLGLGVLWVTETFPLLLGWVLTVDLPWPAVVAGSAATLAVCLCAAAIPAHRAAGLEPAAALRAD